MASNPDKESDKKSKDQPDLAQVNAISVINCAKANFVFTGVPGTRKVFLHQTNYYETQQ